MQREFQYLKILKWAGRAVVLGLLVYAFMAANPIAAISSFDSGFWFGLAIAQAPFVIGIAILAIRHVILIGRPRVKIITAFKALLISGALNYLVPGQIAEITKATYLAGRAAVPMGVGLSVTVLGKMLDLLVVMGAGLGALWAVGNTGSLWPFALAMIAMLLFVTFAPSILNWCARGIEAAGITMFQAPLEKLALAFQTRRSPGLLAASTGLTVVSWAFYSLGIGLFVYYAGKLVLSPAELLVLVSASALGAAIPLFPGAVGTYEGAVVLALTQLGVSAGEAVALALGLRICNSAVVLPVGLVLASREGTGIYALLKAPAPTKGMDRKLGSPGHTVDS